MLRYDKNKESLDFFETPTTVIQWIIPYLNKNYLYYDPCIGRGQIAKILQKNDIKCIGSDIRTENIYGQPGIDFLKDNSINFDIDSFIMNPPFNLSLEFIEKCLDISENNNLNYDIWIFEKLSFIASKRRSDLMNNNLSGLYVCSRRPSMYKADLNLDIYAEYEEKPMGGTIDFAWFKFNMIKDENKQIVSLK